MVEVEWLMCTDPQLMLWYLWNNKVSDRKRRLFACACCRRIWNELEDDRSQWAVVVAERFADGLVTDKELQAAANPASAVSHAYWRGNAFREGVPRPLSDAAYNAAIPLEWWGGAPKFAPPDEIIRAIASDQVERAAQCALLRDIFGNPFRPVTFDPAWRSSDVQLLARGIYEERAFDRLPILADALQDAGCDCDELLTHFRDSTAPHVRGCWALDLVLGKE